MSPMKSLRGCAAALALVAASYGSAARAEVPAGALPVKVGGAEISMLVRNTVVALDQANRTGNYTVLRDLGGSHFRAAYSPAALSDMFRNFRDLQISLAPAVVFDPRLDVEPRLTTDGLLRVLGHFPTMPQKIIFDVTYRYETGYWRVEDLNVGLRAESASADSAAAPSPSPQDGIVAPVPQKRPAHLRL